MNPNQPNQQTVTEDPQAALDMQKVNPLNAMRPGEVVIFSVKRHPIGLIGVYASFILLLLIVGVVAVAAPDLLGDNVDKSMVSKIGALAFVVSAAFAALFSFIAHVIYFGNRWILTSDSLTQVTQSSLFNKQNSQLSLGNLEDVTVQQDGILTHIFNFGVLKAETAGEHSKFTFNYCPNPNVFAQKILVARESFEQGQWYAEQRPDHGQNSAPPTVNTPGDVPPFGAQ